jgi:DMSO/TMAO reductase YedYZ molybdopterin-dependent catalytic subunit
MHLKENRDALQPEDTSPTKANTEQEIAALSKPESAEETLSGSPRVEPSGAGEAAGEQEVSPEEAKAPALTDVEGSKAAKVVELQPELNEVLRPSVGREPEPAESTPSIAAEPASALKANSFSREQPPRLIKVAPHVLRHWTRRDVLLFGAGAIAALAGAGSLLPQDMLERLGVIPANKAWPKREWFLNRALRIDDDVAAALYSENRLVPTYTKSQITPLRNNYDGATPDPSYIPDWQLELTGLASGLRVSLNIHNLLTRFQMHEQITRLVCVEGWSAIAWWSGLRFDDLLHAYPPTSQAKWVRVESSVNLDPSGNPDPYFASLDLPTARHPQTLLATHFNGQPLTVDHGAPLRLLVPMKLGLKNVKAVTKLSFVADEPEDYWAERGYSRYDGI